jgi:hypothetical protein
MMLAVGSNPFPWNGDVGRKWRSERGFKLVRLCSKAWRRFSLAMGVGTVNMMETVLWVLTVNGTFLFILLISQHSFQIFIFGKALKSVVCWRMFM